MKTFNKRKKMINNQPMPRMKTPVKYLIVAMAASIMTPISQADVKNKRWCFKKYAETKQVEF